MRNKGYPWKVCNIGKTLHCVTTVAPLPHLLYPSSTLPNMMQMRSALLAAQINVLSRLGDVASVRSLVTARESDFQRCSTDLLRHCMQVTNLVLGENQFFLRGLSAPQKRLVRCNVPRTYSRVRYLFMIFGKHKKTVL